MNKKITIILALALIFAAFIGFASYHKPNNITQHNILAAEPSNVLPETKPTVERKTKLFSSTDEILKKYGRLEIVTLRDGRQFKGAVITVSDTYEMVTINETVSFPLSEVKARDIIQ